MVDRANPVARATTVTPPYPISRASAAAHWRLRRSSNSGATTQYLRRRRVTAGGSRTPFYDRLALRVQELTCMSYFCASPNCPRELHGRTIAQQRPASILGSMVGDPPQSVWSAPDPQAAIIDEEPSASARQTAYS